MKMVFAAAFLVLTILFLDSAMGAPHNFTEDQLNEYSVIQENITRNKCQWCHGVKSAQQLLDMGWFIPGNSKQSKMIRRMTGEVQPKMPLNSVLDADPAKADAMILQIKNWIDSLTPQ